MIDFLKKRSENSRIIITNVVGAFLIKGFALIVSLLSTPAYIQFFNNDAVLGLWFTLLSVIHWVLNFDLGIGNGLRNCLAKSLTENDYKESQKYISSAYISISVISIIASLIFSTIAFFVNWNMVFNIEQNLVSEQTLLISVVISFAGIMLQMIMKTIQSILYAMQKSWINNLLALSTSTLTLFAILVYPSSDNNTNMLVMSIIHVVAVIAPLLIATIIVFTGNTLRKMVPSLKYFSLTHAKKVVSLGGLFLFVQISYMLLLGTNEYFISLFASSGDVVFYKIYYQIFALGGTLFALALTPVWSAVTKAMAEKNYAWIKQMYNKFLLLLLCAAIIEFLCVPFLQIIINIWLGKNYLTVNIYYALVFAIFGSMLMLNSVVSSIANGLGKLKTQALCFTLGFVIKFAITGLLVNILDSWIGVQLASIISMIPFCIIQPIVLNNYLKSKLKE